MTTVVLSPYGVADFPDGGGHVWAYLQYVHGLRAAGCEVWWLERLNAGVDPGAERRKIATLTDRLGRAGLSGRVILYTDHGEDERRYITVSSRQAERVFARADLLLNFHYAIDPRLLERFARTALVDIDPGLLQIWIDHQLLSVASHDVYFTTGETVGTPEARFPRCEIDWVHIRPPVSLGEWPYVSEEGRDAFTTISTWWGDEWILGEDGDWYENNKRVSFLEYAALPDLVASKLELALGAGPGDAEDLRLLDRHGWRVRHSREVTATPDAYRDYVQRSRGELSCAKPSCMRLQNAWISDRTLCYLASGRPAVVQHTGPNPYLDGCDGLLRFSCLAEAAEAVNLVASDYARRRVAARELAATHFDSDSVIREILNVALARQLTP